jgi:phosphosulfolactate synthase
MKVSEFIGLDLPERPGKPRQSGFTSVIDGGGTPLSNIADILATHGEYIDLMKPTSSFFVSPVEELKKRIALMRQYDVGVQPNGLFLEIARLQGKEREVLAKLRELGFTHVEVSSSTTDNNTAADDREFAKVCIDMGFVAVGEVGKKFPTGDRTRLAPDKVNVDVTIEEMQAFLDLGVEHVYWEGDILRRVIGETPEEVKERYESASEQIRAVTKEIPVEHIVFEVTSLLTGPVRRMLQTWFIREFGPDVNLANIPPRDVARVESMRRGIAVVHGIGKAGDHPWVRSIAGGETASTGSEWWRN